MSPLKTGILLFDEKGARPRAVDILLQKSDTERVALTNGGETLDSVADTSLHVEPWRCKDPESPTLLFRNDGGPRILQRRNPSVANSLASRKRWGLTRSSTTSNSNWELHMDLEVTIPRDKGLQCDCARPLGGAIERPRRRTCRVMRSLSSVATNCSVAVWSTTATTGRLTACQNVFQ